MPVAKKNFVTYATAKQSRRIGELRRELEFHARAQQEIAKPIVDKFNSARLALALAIEELGVPADGRVVHFKDHDDARGPEGVYFETGEHVFDHASETWVQRSPEDAARWVAAMAARGVTVEMDCVPPGSAPLDGMAD